MQSKDSFDPLQHSTVTTMEKQHCVCSSNYKGHEMQITVAQMNCLTSSVFVPLTSCLFFFKYTFKPLIFIW